MGSLIYFTNNNGTLELNQEKPDGCARIKTYHNYRDHSTVEEVVIPPGDMVMLLNYYRYIKENNIQNDFINPHGVNKEEEYGKR